MKIFFALLALHFGYGSLYDSKEADETVQLLGNDSYEVREKAQKKLEDMRVPVLYLEKNFNTSEDPEIRYRLNAVIRKKISYPYTKDEIEKWDQIPSIWKLPAEERFPFGSFKKEIVIGEYQKTIGKLWGQELYETVQIKGDITHSFNDISLTYYCRALAYMGKVKTEYYYEWNVAREATVLLIKDLMRSGFTVEECKELLRKMSENMVPRPTENQWYYNHFPPDPAVKIPNGQPQVVEDPN